MFEGILEYGIEVEKVSHAMAAIILSDEILTDDMYDNYVNDIFTLTEQLSRRLSARTKRMLRGQTQGDSNIKRYLIDPTVKQ